MIIQNDEINFKVEDNAVIDLIKVTTHSKKASFISTGSGQMNHKNGSYNGKNNSKIEMTNIKTTGRIDVEDSGITIFPNSGIEL